MVKRVKRRVELTKCYERIRPFFVRECAQFVNGAFRVPHQSFGYLDGRVSEGERVKRFTIARLGPGDPISIAAGQFRDPEAFARLNARVAELYQLSRAEFLAS
jgi:hypothetical protein